MSNILKYNGIYCAVKRVKCNSDAIIWHNRQKRMRITKDMKSTNKTVLFKEEVYAIQGAVFDVYREVHR